MSVSSRPVWNFLSWDVMFM